MESNDNLTDFILYQYNTYIEHWTLTLLPLPKIGRICPVVWTSLASLCARPMLFCYMYVTRFFCFVLDAVYKFSCFFTYVWKWHISKVSAVLCVFRRIPGVSWRHCKRRQTVCHPPAPGRTHGQSYVWHWLLPPRRLSSFQRLSICLLATSCRNY